MKSWWVWAVLLSACGGDVVVDADGSGQGASGQGGSGATGATGSTGTAASGQSSATSTVSSGTGGAPCINHDACGPGNLCVFSTGLCAPSCDAEFCASCNAGTFCDGCATSACPDCLDCRGACVPTPAGRCDENDPCPPEAPVCIFQLQQCAPACIATGTGCAEPGLYCQDCVTGSCCGCDDCVSACIVIDR